MTKTRMTSQRLNILEYLRKVKTHPTAEMVHEEIVKDLPAITLATVYRNLNILAAQGHILKFEVNKEYRFDGYICSHQHCVCRNCGKIIDIFDKKLSDHALKRVDKKKFNADSVGIIFYGTCTDCRKGGR